MVEIEPTDVRGALSWSIASDAVTASITVTGAKVAPVVFRSGDRTAAPYSLAPWAPGTVPGVPPLLDALRGDFFCLPFAEQPEGPLHGEPASSDWSLVSQSDSSITVHLDASDSGASIDKTVSVRPGETVLYQEFLVAGLDGRYSYGTHPILDFSQEDEGAARISTSPMLWCSTHPGLFSDPARGETQILAQGATFESLESIPAADGGSLDMSRYPTAPGHEDLVMLGNDPASGRLGWSAAVFHDFVWYSIKDVTAFPATLLWISNGGRTQPPWSSQHVGRLGIEDVCSYFAVSLDASRADLLHDQGIRTTRDFAPDVPVPLRIVQGVAFTPAGFGRVVDIATDEPGQITITDEAGISITTPVDWSFVLTDEA